MLLVVARRKFRKTIIILILVFPIAWYVLLPRQQAVVHSVTAVYFFDEKRKHFRQQDKISYSAIADGAISSRFSMLHSSRNSKIGDGCDPTEMYAIRARFFTSPTALPCTAIRSFSGTNSFSNDTVLLTRLFVHNGDRISHFFFGELKFDR